jgi:hypothetical protein
MTLDASGNLGLGTTVTTAISGGYTGLFMNGSSGSNIDFRAGGTGYGRVQADVNGLLFAGLNSVPITFFTGGSERMRITSGGNVGIGSASPTFAGGGGGLHINQSGTDTRLHLTNSTTGTAATDGFELALVGNDVYYDSKESAGTHIFYTAGSERMRITSGGLVGIGTSAPTEKLEVNGAIRATGAVTNNSTGAVLSYEGSSGSLLGAWGADASTYGFLRFYLANSTGTQGAEYMRLTTTGLGIGTTSPTVKLQVDNNTHNYFQLNSTVANVQTSISAQNTSSNNRTSLSWEDGTRGAYGDLYSSTYLTLSTGAGEKARLTNAGELLINTTSDAGDYKLQVNGAGYFSANTGAVQSVQITNASASGFSVLTLSNTGASGRSYDLGVGGNTSGQNGNFYIYDNNASATRMTINSSGNTELGGSIKTAAPSAGNAAAWKLGERVASAGVTFNDQQYIQLDIAGTTYYLATVDLPMPEAYPQATSGPSNNYKMAPVQVKTTRDAEIEKLRKEIEELKQLIKNK